MDCTSWGSEYCGDKVCFDFFREFLGISAFLRKRRGLRMMEAEVRDISIWGHLVM
jgi:hypothetical protein